MFNPVKEPRKSPERTKDQYAIHVFYGRHRAEAKTRFERAAKALDMSESEFGRHCIAYALDHLGTQPAETDEAAA